MVAETRRDSRQRKFVAKYVKSTRILCPSVSAVGTVLSLYVLRRAALTCSPKSDPGVMRVPAPDARAGGLEDETKAIQSGADYSQASGGRSDVVGRQSPSIYPQILLKSLLYTLLAGAAAALNRNVFASRVLRSPSTVMMAPAAPGGRNTIDLAVLSKTLRMMAAYVWTR